MDVMRYPSPPAGPVLRRCICGKPIKLFAPRKAQKAAAERMHLEDCLHAKDEE